MLTCLLTCYIEQLKQLSLLRNSFWTVFLTRCYSGLCVKCSLRLIIIAVTSRLRKPTIYPRPSLRTKRYCSAVSYALLNISNNNGLFLNNLCNCWILAIFTMFVVFSDGGSTRISGWGFSHSGVRRKTLRSGLADLNRADFNHWFKSWLKSNDFFVKKIMWFKSQLPVHKHCLLGLKKQYWTQAHALFEVIPVFICFIHWLWVWESTWHTVLSSTSLKILFKKSFLVSSVVLVILCNK